ncbi:MAG: hypothetical protein E6K41_12285 [Gammaproteobacteria bacterium]|nr:MAG: hypothetical protein E6K41_12285 [Gammaproteobacteria bacterium]
MPFVRLAERRYARHASRQLLDLFWLEQREHPELNGRSLYQAVVARRLGPEAARAPEVIRRAEESFTDWPVERELRFRHVVHYQIPQASLSMMVTFAWPPPSHMVCRP